MARKTPFPGGESSDTTPAETEASLAFLCGRNRRARRPILALERLRPEGYPRGVRGQA